MEAVQAASESAKRKGKRKASDLDEDDLEAGSEAADDDEDPAIDVDVSFPNGTAPPASISAPVPMQPPASIADLRAKLHARMAALRRGASSVNPDSDEAGDRDELIEVRRAQRAAMRERRRKETKEKKRREQENHGKGPAGDGKEKEKSKDAREKALAVKGNQTKVIDLFIASCSIQMPTLGIFLDPTPRTRNPHPHRLLLPVHPFRVHLNPIQPKTCRSPQILLRPRPGPPPAQTPQIKT